MDASTTARAVAVVLVMLACRAPDPASVTTPAKPSITVPVAKPGVPRTLLEDLALLTTGNAPSEAVLARWSKDLTSGTHSTDDVIDELLRDPRFLKRITKVFLWEPYMYLGIARYDRHPGWVLKNTGGDHPIYYVREACDAAVAQDVHPWWDMKTTIKVCPDTYRPTVLWMSAERACSATVAQPGFDKKNVCGCGPNLMRCSPDQETFLEFRRQFVSEVEDTVADIVDHDLPLKNVYLQNDTVRKPLVELQYDIWRAERGEIKELPDVLGTWPADGKRAPRYETEPGDHAGIVTSIGSQWSFTGLRGWMRSLQQSMWCVSHDNSHVEAMTLFEVARGGNSNLRGGDSWKHLAAHPVCGHCHARMDYSWQFFIGYPDHRIATHFVPPVGKFAAGLHMIDPAAVVPNMPDPRTQLGKLYFNDFDDFRGERKKTPLEWAKWAVEQPEFGSCQSRRVVEEVFGRDAMPEDREAIAAVFEKTGQFRPMMREALRRYVGRRLAETTPTVAAPPQFLTAVPSNMAMTPEAMIEIMPETKAVLEKHCYDCHDNRTDSSKNFDVRALPRERLMLMLSYVTARRMPKTTDGLEPTERTRFLTTVVSNLWSTEADRRAAFNFYDQGSIATALQLPDAVLSLVYKRAGASPKTPASPMIETTISPQEQEFTPGFAAHIAVEALRACKASGAKDVASCVDRATNLEGLVRPQ